MEIAAPDLFLKVLDRLDEAQARWYAGREAIALGRGGLKTVSEVTGISRPTVLKGMRELRAGLPEGLGPGRVRRAGAGRKRLEVADPKLDPALDKIMAQSTAGDPMSALRWTAKSTARIAQELTRQHHPVSGETVRRRLIELGYSLQSNVKTKEGSAPPTRDAQFRYINALVKDYQRRGQPVLSVDTKKKEQVGEFKNGGRSWRKKGRPVQVNVYDFPSLGRGPAIPYGAYDLTTNEGFVSVGVSHDTAEFAVASIKRWWRWWGRRQYPKARQLLLCADGGGSNGSRNRAWKFHLQDLADRTGLRVTVCHYPPGTSKWNKIEHRLFSFISLTWKGEPLLSYATVINLIGSTTTTAGLKVRATLDRKLYEPGVQITDDEFQRVNVKGHATHPEWNYTIAPTSEQK